MNSPFRGTTIIPAIFMVVVLGMASSYATGDGLFLTVPEGDATYTQLHQLEGLGLLPKDSFREPLTRYEVAQLILKAKAADQDRQEILLAQAEIETDDEIPSPPDESAVGQEEQPPVKKKVEGPLTTLEQAYQAELYDLQYEMELMGYRLRKAQDAEARLGKKLRRFETNAALYIYGLGRAFTRSDLGGRSVTDRDPVMLRTNSQNMYLDLNPVGMVSKEVSWDGILRVAGDVNPPHYADTVEVRRVSMHFNPRWLSATLGDFDESYTPLTLWNRRVLDLRFFPDILDRQDRYRRYEGFLDHEPFLPLRGARVGTTAQWPDSKVLDKMTVSAFADMSQDGFWETGGYADHRYTTWTFGGRTTLKARRYLEVDACGVVLDEPMDTDAISAVHDPEDGATWAQRYTVASVRPKLEVGLTEDLALGGQVELSSSHYQDDKLDAAKVIDDYAMLGGPFLRYRRSTLQFNVVDNGPQFFSPLAQLRQQDGMTGDLPYPFMITAGRPTGYAYYSRSSDNVFPYGAATPNRKGYGIEADWKGLKNDVFGLKASVYLLDEIQGNLVLDDAGHWIPADVPLYSPEAIRKFTYVNVGPKLNVAPLLDLSHDLEFGFNVRSERTESWIGTLTSDWLVLGLRAGLTTWWEASLNGSTFRTRGRESSQGSTGAAKYVFAYDDTVLGSYSIMETDWQVDMGEFASTFRVGRNSKIILEVYSRLETDRFPDSGRTAKAKQGGGGLVYEITF